MTLIAHVNFIASIVPITHVVRYLIIAYYKFNCSYTQNLSHVIQLAKEYDINQCGLRASTHQRDFPCAHH